MAPEHTTQHLSVSLIKLGIGPESAVLQEKVGSPQPVVIDGNEVGTLYTKSSKDNRPKWLSFFGESLSPGLDLRTASAGALLLVESEGRLFAVSFGTGRFLLNDSAVEPRFGLHTTLNTVAEDTLRSLDKKTFLDSELRLHARQQADRPVSLSAFGLNVEQDLLRAVTGEPEDSDLGSAMGGADALKVSVKATVADLPRLLSAYYKQFRSDLYLQRYPAITNIQAIGDSALLDQLNGKLFEDLRQGKVENLWFSLPEVVDRADFGGLELHIPRVGRKQLDGFHVGLLLTALEPALLAQDHLRRGTVKFVSSTTGTVAHRWPLLHCLSYETAAAGGLYLLSDGSWYEVSDSLVDSTDRHFNDARRVDLALPEYQQSVGTENDYNASVASARSDLVLLDCKNISPQAGQSPFEVCDLYTSTRQFVHVKKYGSSSLLSHLFAQGAVSGELFYYEQTVREQVDALLPDSHRIPETGRRPNRDEYEVVFAIIKEGKQPLSLPFFSRLNFKNSSERLERLGYRVALSKIRAADGSVTRIKRRRAS